MTAEKRMREDPPWGGSDSDMGLPGSVFWDMCSGLTTALKSVARRGWGATVGTGSTAGEGAVGSGAGTGAEMETGAEDAGKSAARRC